MSRLWVLAVVTLVALISLAVSEEAKAEEKLVKGKFLFGSYSTATYTVVAASTSTVYYSCVQGSAAALCTGRKKSSRMLQKAAEPLMEEKVSEGAPETSLEPSSDERNVQETIPKETEGKFAFTIWTTSKTTSSITVFYTNTSTTIRLSYACVAGAMSKPTGTCVG